MLEALLSAKEIGRRNGLVNDDILVLLLLEVHGELNPGIICSKTKIHPAQVSRNLARLQELGFVSRTIEKKDRRCIKASITPKGSAAVKDFRKKNGERS